LFVDSSGIARGSRMPLQSQMSTWTPWDTFVCLKVQKRSEGHVISPKEIDDAIVAFWAASERVAAALVGLIQRRAHAYGCPLSDSVAQHFLTDIRYRAADDLRRQLAGDLGEFKSICEDAHGEEPSPKAGRSATRSFQFRGDRTLVEWLGLKIGQLNSAYADLKTLVDKEKRQRAREVAVDEAEDSSSSLEEIVDDSSPQREHELWELIEKVLRSRSTRDQYVLRTVLEGQMLEVDHVQAFELVRRSLSQLPETDRPMALQLIQGVSAADYPGPLGYLYALIAAACHKEITARTVARYLQDFRHAIAMEWEYEHVPIWKEWKDMRVLARELANRRRLDDL